MKTLVSSFGDFSFEPTTYLVGSEQQIQLARLSVHRKAAHK